MFPRRLARVVLVAAALGAGTHGQPARNDLPATTLSVWTAGGWETFWSSTRAPATWQHAHPVVARAVVWQQTGPGVEVAELRMSGSGLAARLRVVLVRLDPGMLEFDLPSATREAGLLGAWTIDSMPGSARVAFNAGQFSGGAPWGWQVRGGRELQAPGTGPLAMGVVFDTTGSARLLDPAELGHVRARGDAVVAFQSYPAVLVGDGAVPWQLRRSGSGVDLSHRDARLALGIMDDGRLLLALTRFDALGEAAAQLPLGPTTPEMAALMGALGCRRAVLLDGGLSAQLAVRAADSTLRSWNGLRRVPLGIVATPRPMEAPPR